jgi:hypothetical protein
MQPTDSLPCGCHPGTEDNGWQEQRSTACWERELDEWRALITGYYRSPTLLAITAVCDEQQHAEGTA